MGHGAWDFQQRSQSGRNRMSCGLQKPHDVTRFADRFYVWRIPEALAAPFVHRSLLPTHSAFELFSHNIICQLPYNCDLYAILTSI